MTLSARSVRHPAATKALAGRAATARARPGTREQGAQATRDGILRAATRVFARHGYEGGSLEKISRAANSHDRMVYYYFGSKEGLFIEVLEGIYRRMNEAESRLVLDAAKPVEALMTVVGFVLAYYRKHPEFVTLLNTENRNQGRHIAKSARARDYSSPAITLVGQILASGVAQGRFRADLQPRDVYLLIASMGYFYVSNRHTLSAFLGEKLDTPEALAHWAAFATDTVLRTVAA